MQTITNRTQLATTITERGLVSETLATAAQFQTAQALVINPREPSPQFELAITSVSPDLPIERFPITIFFTLKNNTQSPVSGTVTCSFLNGVYRVNNLAPNDTLTTSMSGPVTAKAGRGQTLSLSFYKDDPNTEFPNVSASSFEFWSRL